MTELKHNELIQELSLRGYKKCAGIKRADYTYFKAFGKSKYEEDRSNYQIAVSVYDWRKYIDRDEGLKDRPFSVVPTIMVSRTVNERIDLDLSSHSDFRNIREIEMLGEKFFKWAEQNIEIAKNESED